MILKNLTLVFFLLISELVLAQGINEANLPQFKGGELARIEFLQKNLIYPEIARDYCISGIVYIKFIVDTLGNLDSIRVIKGAHPFLNKEALRVVRSSNGLWIPAHKNNKPVKSAMVFPIKFTHYCPGCEGKDFYNLGVGFYKKGEIDKAFSFFKKAVRSNPYDVDALS